MALNETYWKVHTEGWGKENLDFNDGTIRVRDMDRVVRDLNAKIAEIKNASRRGLIAAGLYIQRMSQKNSPVDLGNLKASAFTIWPGKKGAKMPNFTGDDTQMLKTNHEIVSNKATGTVNANSHNNRTVVEVGHTAFYAVYVHEDMAAKHPVGTAKFLQRALSENQPKILELVREEISEELKKK